MTFQWPSSPKEAGLKFYDLSHPWGHGVPAWPYFEDVKIERLHGMAKSRVLTQKITTVMHSGTHIDAPGHVVEGTPLLHEIPLQRVLRHRRRGVHPEEEVGGGHRRGPGEAPGPEIRPGDIVIVNTGWHHNYGDSAEYYAYSPGFYKEAGEWFVARGVKAVGTDTPGPRPSAGHRDRPARPAEAHRWPAALGVSRVRGADRPQRHATTSPSGSPATARILSNGIYGFENVGGDLDSVTGKRVTFAAFPWRWVGGRRLHRAAGRHPRPDRRATASRPGSEAMTCGSPAPRPRRPTWPPGAPRRGDQRLQGHEAGPTERFWVGLSLLPARRWRGDLPTAEETVYVVLDGALVVTAGAGRKRSGPFDSVHLPKGRSAGSRTGQRAPATLLVIIANQQPPAP